MTKIGHGLAKGLGIKLQYRDPTGQEKLTRGESVFSVSSADTFVEEEPTTLEWLNEILPTGHTFVNWIYHLFPFTHWILKYNLKWLQGDLIAGTVVYQLLRASERCANCKLAHRDHCRCCGSPAEHGIRKVGTTPGAIRFVFFLHGRLDLLAFWHVKGYHDRGEHVPNLFAPMHL